MIAIMRVRERNMKILRWNYRVWRIGLIISAVASVVAAVNPIRDFLRFGEMEQLNKGLRSLVILIICSVLLATVFRRKGLPEGSKVVDDDSEPEDLDQDVS